jgi:hypothetical protein
MSAKGAIHPFGLARDAMMDGALAVGWNGLSALIGVAFRYPGAMPQAGLKARRWR